MAPKKSSGKKQPPKSSLPGEDPGLKFSTSSRKGNQSGGFQFNSPVTGRNQTFINGDVGDLRINQGLSANELRQLDLLFQPLKEHIQLLPHDKKSDAEKRIKELHTELAKGMGANPNRLNMIIDVLMEMAPGDLGTIVSIFASPVLAALVGSATELVLDHLKK